MLEIVRPDPFFRMMEVAVDRVGEGAEEEVVHPSGEVDPGIYKKNWHILLKRVVVWINKLANLHLACVVRRLEVVGTRKNGRVSLSHACSFLRPLLPSTCYTG